MLRLCSYIQLRPELSESPKDPDKKKSRKKFHIIGRAYSSMNPKGIVNYIQFSIVFSEFLQVRYTCLSYLSSLALTPPPPGTLIRPLALATLLTRPPPNRW